MGGALTSTKPKGQHQCHTCGLQWQAPRGTPGRGHCHCQSKQQQPPANTYCPKQNSAPGRLPWAQGGSTQQACSETGLSSPGVNPNDNAHAPWPCPKQAGDNLRSSLKQNWCNPRAFPIQSGARGRGLPHQQPPILSQKTGVQGGLPIVCLRHIIGLMTFKKESITIKTNPVGEGREPF